MADGGGERYAENLTAIAAIAPTLHERLVAADANAARPIEVAIDQGEDRARHAVASYLRNPLRIQHGPVGDTVSPVVTIVRDQIDAFVAQRALAAHAPPGNHRASVLILFGLGSGEELGLLMTAINVRHVIVAEPDIDTIRYSLRRHDWAGWQQTLASRGGGLKVVCAPVPKPLAVEAYLALVECGWTDDGGFYYLGNSALESCVHEFRSRMTTISGAGWLEDEMVMLGNAMRNLASHPARFITNGRPTRKAVPALIVGAGPSLDRTLPLLARLAEGAVVFSVGSTIGTLLRHGIVPDFHCEIENKPENYMALRLVADAHDLSALTLLSTATVDPRVPGMFGDKLFYLRHPGTTADIFGDEMHSIAGTAPNCATLAIRMVSRFGFSEAYLFGTDFGSRRQDAHHVSDSMWNTDPEWRERYARVAASLTIQLPANFGGKAYANRVLFYFLQAAQDLIAASNDMTFFNCSDGVRIEGAVPKVPAAVRIAPDADGRRSAIAEILASADRHPAGGMFDRGRLDHFHQTFGVWTERMLAFLQDLPSGRYDLVDWHDELIGSLQHFGSGNELAGIRSVTWGSLSMMFRHVFHYAIRHDLLHDREYLAAVSEAFSMALRAMRQKVNDTVDIFSARGTG